MIAALKAPLVSLEGSEGKVPKKSTYTMTAKDQTSVFSS